ncbi:MAG: alanine--tRNA ligase, partial [Thermoplasmatota archaeon]
GDHPYTLSEMREAFLSFFEENNHTRLERYPVVARWRNDVYLTIASIADFQPHVTSGEVPPPANPLVISQPSIRLNDLEEVGRSGRHLTMFEMMGHHAFNNHEQIYWSEETIQLCNDFLHSIGISTEQVTYKEGAWHGGGNAGACLEVLAAGMEISTLVFMSLQRSNEGDIEVNHERYTKMPLQVVDTGYGLERLAWLTQGSETVYDAIFPGIIATIRDAAATPEPRDIYALADHTRCLLFMLGDGIVPSNAEEGYLARLIARRALRFIERLNLDMTLIDLVDLHLAHLTDDFPDLAASQETMHAMLDKETDKYRETLDKGRRLVARYVEEHGDIPEEKLLQFYDTHGVPPDVVKEVAGDAVTIPDDFASRVAELHSGTRQTTEETHESEYATKQQYYEEPYQHSFEATVIWSGTVDGSPAVILDTTLFYPEGGGQASDTGALSQGDTERQVLHTEKHGEAIIHVLDGPLKKGSVEGTINWQRRYDIMRHHTATHLINAAARQVLGRHIWQKGSALDDTEARLDVSHYQRITSDEIRRIEAAANTWTREAHDVTKHLLPREQAEQHYGLRLYQGGPPAGSTLRVLQIDGIEVEACGGTHVDNTAEIGYIKITGTERVQDGVERIKFKAAEQALEYVHQRDELLQETADVLDVQPEALPQTVERFFSEWKRLRKQVEELQKQSVSSTVEDFHGIRIVTQDNLSTGAVKDITSQGGTVVVSKSIADEIAAIHIARSSDIDIDCGAIAREIASILGGGGGGKLSVAQAGGPNVEALDDAFEQAIALVKEQLKEKHL